MIHSHKFFFLEKDKEHFNALLTHEQLLSKSIYLLQIELQCHSKPYTVPPQELIIAIGGHFARKNKARNGNMPHRGELREWKLIKIMSRKHLLFGSWTIPTITIYMSKNDSAEFKLLFVLFQNYRFNTILTLFNTYLNSLVRE